MEGESSIPSRLSPGLQPETLQEYRLSVDTSTDTPPPSVHDPLSQDVTCMQAVNQGSYYLSSGLASGAQALKDNLGGGNK